MSDRIQVEDLVQFLLALSLDDTPVDDLPYAHEAACNQLVGDLLKEAAR